MVVTISGKVSASTFSVIHAFVPELQLSCEGKSRVNIARQNVALKQRKAQITKVTSTHLSRLMTTRLRMEAVESHTSIACHMEHHAAMNTHDSNTV